VQLETDSPCALSRTRPDTPGEAFVMWRNLEGKKSSKLGITRSILNSVGRGGETGGQVWEGVGFDPTSRQKKKFRGRRLIKEA